MKRQLFLAMVFALPVSGCPTRTIYYDAGGSGGDGMAGHFGAGMSGQAGGSQAGGHTGFAGGIGGAEAPAARGGAGGTAAGGESGQQGTAGGAAGSTPSRFKDGERCALAGDCASGVCAAYYADLDSDGYGTGAPVGFCGTTAPVGYAVQSGDCCDTAVNLAVAKLIHPGADFQTTSAGGVCNVTWDYDCSGTVETNWKQCSSCTAAPACACIETHWPESDCAKSVAQTPCTVVSAGPSTYCAQTTAGVGPVLCR